MTRTVAVAAVLAVVLGVVQPAAAAGRGTARGVVMETDAWKTENGQLMLSVTIRGEGPWHATFSVGPRNREAYATVGLLREGEHVVIGWASEDGRNWIREIVRKEGEHEEAEAREIKERERDEPGERERHERGEREKQEREERDRDRERREDREPEGRERGEGAERDRERRVDRERGRVRRHRMKATVISVTTDDEEDTRVLKVSHPERDAPMTFTISAKRGDLYEMVGRLKAGDKVVVIWVTEGDRPWLREVGRIDD